MTQTSALRDAVHPRTPEPSVHERTESRAILWALFAFVAVGAICGVWMWGQRLPLAGSESFGRITAWVSGAAGGTVFALAYTGADRLAEHGWRARIPLAKRIFDTVVLTIAFAVVAALSVEAVTLLFQRGFVGMTIDALGGAALAGSIGAFLAYIAGIFGTRVTTSNLAVLATLVLFIGTMASMLTAPDERWWEYHFSQLGNQQGSSGAAFNGALILTGLIITVFAGYAARDAGHGLRLHHPGLHDAGLHDAQPSSAQPSSAQPPSNEAATGATPGAPRFWSLKRRRSAVQWMLVVIGVCMMIAGLIHDAMNTPVHVAAASGMVVVFGFLGVFSLTLLPGVPNSFHALTIGVLIGIVVSILLWVPIGYYALTGVEFVSAGLLFAWFVVFARTIAAYAAER